MSRYIETVVTAVIGANVEIGGIHVDLTGNYKTNEEENKTKVISAPVVVMAGRFFLKFQTFRAFAFLQVW